MTTRLGLDASEVTTHFSAVGRARLTRTASLQSWNAPDCPLWDSYASADRPWALAHGLRRGALCCVQVGDSHVVERGPAEHVVAAFGEATELEARGRSRGRHVDLLRHPAHVLRGATRNVELQACERHAVPLDDEPLDRRAAERVAGERERDHVAITGDGGEVLGDRTWGHPGHIQRLPTLFGLPEVLSRHVHRALRHLPGAERLALFEQLGSRRDD